MVSLAWAHPKGPVARVLGFWDCQAPVPDSPCCQATTWAHQCPMAHSVWEKVQSPPSPRRHLKAPHAKTLVPMPPLHRDLTTTCHSVHHTPFHLFLWASWGLTLTLHLPPWGPSQVAWRCNTGDWGQPSPCARLTLSPSHHRGESGPCCSFRMGVRSGHCEQWQYS